MRAVVITTALNKLHGITQEYHVPHLINDPVDVASYSWSERCLPRSRETVCTSPSQGRLWVTTNAMMVWGVASIGRGRECFLAWSWLSWDGRNVPYPEKNRVSCGTYPVSHHLGLQDDG